MFQPPNETGWTRVFVSSADSVAASVAAMQWQRPWSAESLLRLVLRLFLVLGVTGLLSVAAEEIWPAADAEARRFWISAVSGMVVQIGGLTLIALFLRENNLSWESAFGLRRAGAVRQVALGCAVAAGVFVLSLGLMLLSQWLMQQVHLTPRPQTAIEALQTSPDLARRWAVGVTAILLAPVFEELVFRGVLLIALRQAGYPRLAFWGTAVFFAATHLNLMTFLPLVFFALVLNVLYLRTGSLIGPITAHAVFNGTNFAWVVLGGPGS